MPTRTGSRRVIVVVVAAWLGLIAVAAAILLGGWMRESHPDYSADFVRYVPTDVHIHSGTWEFEERPDLLTDEHIARLIEYLDARGAEYRFRDGHLEIERELLCDQEMMYNLTAKAGLPADL